MNNKYLAIYGDFGYIEYMQNDFHNAYKYKMVGMEFHTPAEHLKTGPKV